MIDNKLAAPSEKVSECDASVGAFKLIVFPHLRPRQGAAFAADIIKLFERLLFLVEELRAGGDPFVVADDRMVLEFGACRRGGNGHGGLILSLDGDHCYESVSEHWPAMASQRFCISSGETFSISR